MIRNPKDRESLWDIATPEERARSIIESHGAAAAERVVRFASAAYLEGRREDYRFWSAVHEIVKAAQGKGDS